ncbi:MAG TPA: cyclic nucleotide-binding domain-containing protein [Vicinamibacteria bacterium]|nr:cyclic nucleotide-binding domain-containing protein [Vicinamibacteria bacterium]
MSTETRTIGHVERILSLHRIPVLGTLPSVDLASIAEIARERSVPRGSVLFREGEPVQAVQVVVEGTVHIRRKGRLVGHAGPGSAVGGIGVLARDEEGIQATAEADTLTLEIGGDGLFELMEDQFSVFHHVLREVCLQMIGVVSRFPAALEQLPPITHALAKGTRELDLVGRIMFLRESEFFHRASINALAELSRGMLEVRYEAGQTIWSVGESPGWVLVILEGYLSCTTAAGFRFRLGPGTPPGGLEATAESPRWYTAVAETPLLALQGRMEWLLDLFEDNFDMGTDYLAVLSQRLAEVMEATSGPDEEGLQLLYGCDEEEPPPSASGSDPR